MIDDDVNRRKEREEFTDLFKKLLENSYASKIENYQNETINYLDEKIKGKSKDKYRMMINFEVDNIYKSFKRLKSFNVEIIRKPYQEHWGGFICTFQDYDENIVQFIQQSTND